MNDSINLSEQVAIIEARLQALITENESLTEKAHQNFNDLVWQAARAEFYYAAFTLLAGKATAERSKKEEYNGVLLHYRTLCRKQDDCEHGDLFIKRMDYSKVLTPVYPKS